MSWEWPPWFRWLVRGVAVVVILYFGLAFTTMLPVNSAGNAGIRFITELEGFRGGPEKGYDRLCSSEKARIGRDQFLESDGAEYSVLAGAGAVGSATQHPDVHPLDKDIKQWWKEYEITVAGRVETWRLFLVREHSWWQFKGDWKVCGIELRN